MNVLHAFWKCDQIFWFNNIHTAAWTMNFGDVANMFIQIFILVWPLNSFWAILIDDSCWLSGPILKGFILYTRYTLPQTLQWESLKSSELI